MILLMTVIGLTSNKQSFTDEDNERMREALQQEDPDKGLKILLGNRYKQAEPAVSDNARQDEAEL